jgi:hypothetical protein
MTQSTRVDDGVMIAVICPEVIEIQEERLAIGSKFLGLQRDLRPTRSYGIRMRVHQYVWTIVIGPFRHPVRNGFRTWEVGAKGRPGVASTSNALRRLASP